MTQGGLTPDEIAYVEFHSARDEHEAEQARRQHTLFLLTALGASEEARDGLLGWASMEPPAPKDLRTRTAEFLQKDRHFYRRTAPPVDLVWTPPGPLGALHG